MEQQALIRLGWHNTVDPDTILFMRADSNYTQVHLNNGSMILSSTTLGSLAKRLPAYQFIRANRSVLVNINFTLEYEKSVSSITLCNNEVIQVSRRRTKQVRRSIRQ